MINIDIHTHSRYSRATSPSCDLPGLHRAAQLKGIDIVGTGDFTHPAHFADLQKLLTPSAPGLYRLTTAAAAIANTDLPPSCRAAVQFMLTAEISSIYRRDGQCRKVHSILTAPTLEAVAKINARLAAVGNITADGRPILGLDPRDLFDLILEIDPACNLIPAHIWTPWFAVLGSKSGFDAVADCFGPYTKYICAVETGLSSDPPMNWRVASLNHFALISNSDLHSPANLARNATRFYGTPNYFTIFKALADKDLSLYAGTINLYPEAGKYFADGHRNCGFSSLPCESRALNNICPKCQTPLTLGVLHRVEALATHPLGYQPPHAAPCHHIIPLHELVGECLNKGPATKTVQTACATLITKFGPELTILLDTPLTNLADTTIPRFTEAITNLRSGNVRRTPGYDGLYGTITTL
jgi:uncharacterized protein (TIGR00375 family)